MSLIADSTEKKNVTEYDKLVDRKDQITKMITQWVGRGTALHGSVTDPAEKAEVVALRDQLDAEITAILGV